MTNDSPYVAKRASASVPVWNILAHGQEIGVATVYDNEGPMATVRYHDLDMLITFQGSSIYDVLAQVGSYLRDVDEGCEVLAEAEYYSEVIGPMEAAEREAEYFHIDDEPIW